MKNHGIKKPPLRSVKSVDKLEFLKSKEANHKMQLRAILEENGRQSSLTGQKKSRRHSDIERNGALLTRLCGNDYLKPLHLKGQMKYLKKYDMVLFVCSPM